MSQITTGLRAILSNPKIYDFFQQIMGANYGRTIFSSQYIKAQDGDYVLDIGCGTAEIRFFLPNVEYFGFDPNARYIEAAKKRFQVAHKSGKLLHATLDTAILTNLPKFDIVLLMGVLHHLNDDEAKQLARLAMAALKPNGRLITSDPCFSEEQSFMARYLVSKDRGQHVRNVEGYKALMSSVFSTVNCDLRDDFARFPYTHLIMECQI